MQAQWIIHYLPFFLSMKKTSFLASLHVRKFFSLRWKMAFASFLSMKKYLGAQNEALIFHAQERSAKMFEASLFIFLLTHYSHHGLRMNLHKARIVIC